MRFQVISPEQVLNMPGRPSIDYELDRPPYTRYRWNGSQMVEAGAVSGAGNPLPAVLNGHDVMLDGPMTRVGLTHPYSSFYGTYDQEFAYGPVRHAKNGWNGWKYWMASAPYPNKAVGQGFTVTIANPAVITSGVGSPPVDTPVTFSTTGALPTGLDTQTVYYVLASGLKDKDFQVSLSKGGAPVVTTGAQSGSHQVWTTAGGQVQMTIGSQVLQCANALPPDSPIIFATSGALPTGLPAGNCFYVLADSWSPTGFKVGTTKGGAPVTPTGAQSGAHTFQFWAPKAENPYMQVSNDRKTWIPVPGMTVNPIADMLSAQGTDAASYLADPFPVFSLDVKTLYVGWHWFARAGAVKSCVMLSESQDGKNWSTPVSISDQTTTTFTPNSFSLVPLADGSGWLKIAVDTAAAGQPLIYSRTNSPTPYTGWYAPGAVYNGEWSLCNAVHPLGRKWWHQYTIAIGNGGLWMLASDNDSSGGTAWSLVSWDNGANWSVRPFAAYDPATAGGAWYRPSVCEVFEDGRSTYHLFASTFNWPKPPNSVESGSPGFYIHTAPLRTGKTLDAMLRSANRDAVNRNVSLVGSGNVVAASFNGADGAVGNADTGQAFTVVSGTWAKASNQLSCTATGIITIDTGLTNFDVQFDLVTMPGNALLVYNYQDQNNRIRWGKTSGAAAIERIAPSGVAYSKAVPIPFVAGQTLRMSKRGPDCSFFVNGEFAYSYRDTYLAEKTVIGFQADTGTVFDNLIVTAA